MKMMMTIALRSLARSKMRTMLTMLGVIIGVAAVIATVALGEGASATIQSRIAGLGTNLVTVFGGSATTVGVRMGAAAVESFTRADVEAIGRDCPSVSALTPVLRKGVQAVGPTVNWSTQLQGVNEAYFAIREWSCDLGSPFTLADVRASAKVCIIGQTVRRELFGADDVVGRVLRVSTVPLTIVGVLAAKGQSTFGQDQDDVVVVPCTTYMNRMRGGDRFSLLLVSAVSADRVTMARDEIAALLRQRHHIRDVRDDDFFIRTQQEISETAEETMATFTWLLGGIAAVSLIVGGIGIMNIMLVSVTERVHEIGIRMAVGARSSDIMLQFVIEALVLSVGGGVVGVVLGAAVVQVVAWLSPWTPVMTASSVMLAFGCSAAVGVFFGYYPARSAARLDPIEALRHE
ncbi:MAG: FtsX-like permease family protein [Proteobacteria bacterium]|nr:FtsX-like permease family protein [Pseudomonadota bacterium]